jgi:hypothetical protein
MGNVAKAIYQGMKTVMDYDLVPVKKAAPEKMRKYDEIVKL